MNKGIFVGLVIAAAVIGATYTVMSIEKVGQGEVGVVWTAKEGVHENTLSPGWHFVGPLAKVKNYPVSQQQIIFSNNPEDYSKKEHPDWHIDAPANGGMVKLNMTVNYNFLNDRVVNLYTRFNGMDGSSIVEGMVQNSIIAYVKEVTPQFSVMDIYSSKRAEVSTAITDYLNEKLRDEYGINISSALIIDVQLDDALYSKIQEKERAKQDAEKAELDKKTAIAVAEKEQEIARREAEKNKEVALIQAEQEKQKAEIEADQRKIQAEGEANATKIKAEAEAEANQKIAASLTPELLEKAKYERWNGQLPTIQGNTTPIVDLK
ncbi:SPFH domain-containing protein [Lacrimispora saccharolytica]|uniref:Band 7 protein n=1 Tax=Lacrimispora saccharolytica (strain ATCC 35040 / DSM 2544 / NRCC 2533 / WM1) TaxID=610130 RepID=D9R5E1_LACSW|nr:SPFH domain-containing protein [Lacrimispora saccharolytica]ADL03347.1 band 7 protein [[Clostridium] saccharolyticum WM1]QRV18494.1 membrane protease [Lacrimispora saccharolytica]